LRRVIRASVQRRRPRSSACASAHRPATARASFGASNGAPALRVELAPPVRSGAPIFIKPAVLRTAAQWGWTVDRTPLLRFRVPCSARLPRRACVCAGRRHLSGDPASTVDRRRRPPSPLAIAFARVVHRAMHALVSATPCTHAPATLAVLAVLRLAELARSTLRGSTPRVLAGTLRRSRRAAASHASEPAASHAPARSSSAGVPLPAVRVTWPGRAPFRRSKLAWVSVP
jgi:hypothetical protein